MRTMPLLAATAVLATALTGCGVSPTADPIVPVPPAADPMVERPAPDSEHVRELAAGLNDVGYRLFHVAAAKGDDDVVLSPLSIGLAFGMVDVGATGVVAEALQELFGYPVEGEERWAAFNALEQQVTDQEGDLEAREGTTVRLANRLFQEEGFEAVAGYAERVLRWFGAGTERLPLQQNPAGSRERINSWVEERTEGLIPELLPEDFLKPDSVLVLVNALYFYGQWTGEFDEWATQDEDFTRLDGSTVTVPMMRDTRRYARAGVGEGFTAIELPYADGTVSMLVIVPDEGRYQDIEAQLDGTWVGRVNGLLKSQSVDLALPRFRSESDLDLREAIAGGLGVGNLFGVEDLLGIGHRVAIDAAVHAAVISVDESGTEAAAATAVGMVLTGMPQEAELVIRADRPFLYLIRESTTGAVLFVGRVMEPQQ